MAHILLIGTQISVNNTAARHLRKQGHTTTCITSYKSLLQVIHQQVAVDAILWNGLKDDVGKTIPPHRIYELYMERGKFADVPERSLFFLSPLTLNNIENKDDTFEINAITLNGVRHWDILELLTFI